MFAKPYFSCIILQYIVLFSISGIPTNYYRLGIWRPQFETVALTYIGRIMAPMNFRPSG
jgi:hypothetical protein